MPGALFVFTDLPGAAFLESQTAVRQGLWHVAALPRDPRRDCGPNGSVNLCAVLCTLHSGVVLYQRR